jgi:hypothetical protein
LFFSCPSFLYISNSIFFHFSLFSFPSIVPFYLFSFLSVFLFESSIPSLIQMTCKIKKFHSLTRLTWFFLQWKLWKWVCWKLHKVCYNIFGALY